MSNPNPTTRRWACGSCAVLAAAALLLAGCSDPYRKEDAKDVRARAQPAAARPHSLYREAGSPVPAELQRAHQPAGSSATPEGVLRAFALLWSNYTPREYAAQQTRLAALATGPLGEDLRAGAKASGVAITKAKEQPSSHGTVVVLAVRGAGAARSAVVVTHEQTFQAGQATPDGDHHRVYLATIARAGVRWSVQSWSVQR